MTRIVFINPPELPGYHSDRDKAGNLGIAVRSEMALHERWGQVRRRRLPNTSTVPLDMLYALALAKALGYETSLIECLSDRLSEDAALEHLAHARADFIGVRLSLPSLDQDLAFVTHVKVRHPQAVVFVFGMVILTTYALWSAHCAADYICYGEIEELLPSILARKQHPSLGIPGLLQPPMWAVVRDLDALPFPRWDHISISTSQHFCDTGVPFVFQILTSRGCPRGCTMCPYTTNQGSLWRYRSAEHVIAELRYLKEQYNARYIQTRDPNIGWKRTRIKDLFTAIAAADLGLEFIIETDLEVLDEESIAILAHAGVKMLYTGIESGDTENLKDIGQSPTAIAILERNIAMCHTYGIQVIAFWLIGFPNDDWGSVMRSTRYAAQLPVDGHAVSVMTPYFGTPMRAEAEALGLIKPNARWLDYNSRTCIQRTKHLNFDDIALAFAYMQGELDLAQRAARYRHHVHKLGHVARHALLKYLTMRHLPLRWEVNRRLVTSDGDRARAVGS